MIRIITREEKNCIMKVGNSVPFLRFTTLENYPGLHVYIQKYITLIEWEFSKDCLRTITLNDLSYLGVTMDK